MFEEKEEKLLPLLSGGLRDLLNKVFEKHHCKIADDLIEADALIETYNLLMGYLTFQLTTDDQLRYNPSIKIIRNGINSHINDEARMLSMRFDSFEISYLPKGKTPIYSDENTWSRQNRQSSKPARLIQKLLVNKYSCKEYEDFNNWLKAESLDIGEFKIVEGDDIQKYYLEDNYYKSTGTLGNSCMRHYDCQPYFEIYKDEAKMLVLIKNNKILGRAIIWEIKGNTYLDRIYTCKDYLVSNFISYAEKNKWYYRNTQDVLFNGCRQKWLGPNDNYEKPIALDLTIYLSCHYKYMPYMDTFRYYNPRENIISTSHAEGWVCLSDTDGSYEDDNEEDWYTCECCGEQFYSRYGDMPDNMIWSAYNNAYYCINCSHYCGGIDDYISNDTQTVDVFNLDGSSEEYPLKYVESNTTVFIKINDKWHLLADCFINSAGNYELKDE